jgi:hypothetical protein
MTERSDDLQRSRHEAALLLRLDPQNLSPSDALRCDLVATLRLSIDSAQADALEGRAADLGRLIVATESLVKLLPSEPPQPAARGADARQIMWENYLGMRRRGELADPMSTFEGRKAEVERLRAKVAELELAEPTGGENFPKGGENSLPETLPPNVVPMSRATTGEQKPFPGVETPAVAPKPAPPPAAAPSRPFVNGTSDLVARYTVPDEPWRQHMNANYDPWADNR